MITTNWIQAISAFVSAIVTIVLARITYIYVRHTKRMAESMKTQTDLEQFKFDKDIKPICKLYLSNHSTNANEGRFDYAVKNDGKEIFTINKIILKIFNEEHPLDILFHKETEPNYDLAPLTEPKRGSFTVNYPQTVSDILNNAPERKKIKCQGFVLVKDIKNNQKEFSDTYRTLWG